MIPRVELDAVDLPGAGTLRLVQRGAEFSIILAGNELMNSRLSGSEEALATLAIARMPVRGAARVLIGGLGMGFTLRAALAGLEAEARVVMVELLPAIIAWARGPLAPLFAGSLEDARVELACADVADAIAGAAGRYDAILLDVDNGPDGLTQPANDRLYGPRGLAAARAALGAGGVLAVWSAAPDLGFARRFGEAGFAVETHEVRAHLGKGARHTVWIGTRG